MVSGYTPTGRPRAWPSSSASASTSSSVGTRNWPSNAAEAGRRSGSRSTARSDWTSASVRSSVNHPSCLDAVDGLGAPPVGELRPTGDVGRLGDLVLVAHDQGAVARGDDVGLDDVGALLDGEPVGFERVLGAVGAGASVGNHEHSCRSLTAAAPLGLGALSRATPATFGTSRVTPWCIRGILGPLNLTTLLRARFRRVYPGLVNAGEAGIVNTRQMEHSELAFYDS